MIVAVHQPNYLPYLGFFHKMMLADCFVLHDTAQFSRAGFQNRNRIKTPQGPTWLTVPVRHPGLKEIREVAIDPSRPWTRRHWKTIQANLSRAPHFHRYADELSGVYRQSWERLAPLNQRLLSVVAAGLGIRTPIVSASELDIATGLSPSDKLVAITKSVGGTAYISGVGGTGYLDHNAFEEIELLLQDFRHPEYPQLWGSFLPNLSAIDFLCNVGSQAGEILRLSGSAKPWPT